MRNCRWVARLESRVRLALPWTRRGEMRLMITMVASHHDVTMAQAYALMYAVADDRERKLLAPYRPEIPDD
jgi:hypothetical protein